MKRWTNGLPGATKRLGANLALRGLSVSQSGCARIPMMARSKIAPLQRPNTLMQLSRSSVLELPLATRGRAVHLAHLGRADPRRKCQLTWGKADALRSEGGRRIEKVRAGQRRRMSAHPGQFGSDNGMLSEVMPPARAHQLLVLLEAKTDGAVIGIVSSN